jgi:hypothetical protein
MADNRQAHPSKEYPEPRPISIHLNESHHATIRAVAADRVPVRCAASQRSTDPTRSEGASGSRGTGPGVYSESRALCAVRLQVGRLPVLRAAPSIRLRLMHESRTPHSHLHSAHCRLRTARDRIDPVGEPIRLLGLLGAIRVRPSSAHASDRRRSQQTTVAGRPHVKSHIARHLGR